MRRIAITTAIAIVGVHLLLRVLGAGEHASILAGMPLSSASWVVGPLHVLFTLAAVTVAPICVIAAAIDAAALRFRSAPRGTCRHGSVEGDGDEVP